MQVVDITELVLGSLMGLMTIYFLGGLFPAGQRRRQDWARRIKSGGGNIVLMSRLRQSFAALVCSLLAANLFAGVFHSSLSVLTGFRPWTIFVITCFIVPPIVLLLGIRDRREFRKRLTQPPAGRSTE